MKDFKLVSLFCLIGFLLVFTSCKDQQGTSREVMLVADSATFNNNQSTDVGNKTVERTKTSVAHKQQNRSTTGSAKHVAEKKGWSKAAQGAVIGGATGAVGGAIISKNKVAGAAVGAAVGAAGGYIIGRDKDKKDSRVVKKKKHKK